MNACNFIPPKILVRLYHPTPSSYPHNLTSSLPSHFSKYQVHSSTAPRSATSNGLAWSIFIPIIIRPSTPPKVQKYKDEMENLSLEDHAGQGQPVLGGGMPPAQTQQLPPQMFTTAAQLLDLTDSKHASSLIPHLACDTGLYAILEILVTRMRCVARSRDEKVWFLGTDSRRIGHLKSSS